MNIKQMVHQLNSCTMHCGMNTRVVNFPEIFPVISVNISNRRSLEVITSIISVSYTHLTLPTILRV